MKLLLEIRRIYIMDKFINLPLIDAIISDAKQKKRMALPCEKEEIEKAKHYNEGKIECIDVSLLEQMVD